MSEYDPITLEHEKSLWEAKELDMNTSKGLVRAVIFYLIKCFGVWQGRELRKLQTKHVSLSEDDHGMFVELDLRSSDFHRNDRVKRYDDPANPRSVYKIMKKYRSRLPNEGPFLVRPITSIKDFICYGPIPLGFRLIEGFISTIMQDAGIGNYFVNKSLNVLSVTTLMRFGIGEHCLSNWLGKNSRKNHLKTIKCSRSNCENLNPDICVMLSRVLDAPCPFNAVDIIQRTQEEEGSRSRNTITCERYDSWMSSLRVTNKKLENDIDSANNSEIVISSPVSIDLTGETPKDHNNIDGLSYKTDANEELQIPKGLDSSRNISELKDRDDDNTSITLATSPSIKEEDPFEHSEKDDSGCSKDAKLCAVTIPENELFEEIQETKDGSACIKIVALSSITEDAFFERVKNDTGKHQNANEHSKKLSYSKKGLDEGITGKSVSKSPLCDSVLKDSNEKTNASCSKLERLLKSKRKIVLSEEEEEERQLNVSKIKISKIDLYNSESKDLTDDTKGQKTAKSVFRNSDRLDEKASLQDECEGTESNAEHVRQCVEMSQENFQKQKMLQVNELNKFQLPKPDLSQDSITILRSLLCSSDVANDRLNNMYHIIAKNKFKTEKDDSGGVFTEMETDKLITTTPLKSATLKRASKNNGDKCSIFRQCSKDYETDTDDPNEITTVIQGRNEDRRTEDFKSTHMTSSPQTSNSTLPDQIDNASFCQNNGTSLNHLSSPTDNKYGSSSHVNSCDIIDIVQCLDKAQQQIKNILLATKVNDQLASQENTRRSNKGASQQNTCKGNKHGNCLDLKKSIVSEDEKVDKRGEDSSRKNKKSEEMSILHSLLSSKSSSMSSEKPHTHSDFSLLRMFLEQPNLKIPLEYTLTPFEEKSQLLHKATISKSPAVRHTNTKYESSKPPPLTYMGRQTTMLQADDQPAVCSLSSNSNDQSLLELDDLQTLSLSKSSHQTELPTFSSNREDDHSFAPPQSNSPPPPLLMSSVMPELTSLDVSDMGEEKTNSTKSNTASFHIEKSFRDKTIYQSLEINSEKDGTQTFTFADVPNLPDSSFSSSSANFQKSSAQLSEINLGDYFPSGTLISASDIHLVTKQGPDGCDIVMKFKYR